jgi:hypothetical protein
MTIKVIFHIIISKRLGQFGTVVYKLLITHFLVHLIYARQTSTMAKISTDLLIVCLRNIVRRLNKIDRLLLFICLNDIDE